MHVKLVHFHWTITNLLVLTYHIDKLTNLFTCSHCLNVYLSRSRAANSSNKNSKIQQIGQGNGGVALSEWWIMLEHTKNKLIVSVCSMLCICIWTSIWESEWTCKKLDCLFHICCCCMCVCVYIYHCFKYRPIYWYIGRDTGILSKTIW